ncbi:MAG TPA: hypothetical protein VKL40_18460 [Candidatus Angelobacter sp.]|nr:hypothetical protein [Candidatus Angelobacter sp.]
MAKTQELEHEVERERKELEEAPKVAVTSFQPRPGHGESGRCGWCGQFTDDLVMAEPAVADPHGNVIRPARYKGVQCCGQRHL